MFCTQCGRDLGMNDRFCSRCGKRWQQGAGAGPKKLMRDMRNKKIAGVCAGLANYLEIDVALVRIILLTLAIGMGVGFVAYIIAWIAMPKDEGWTASLPPATAPVSPPAA